MPNVEIWLDPGGDFQQMENGDLRLAIDTNSSADASIQRIFRLLTTNARLTDDTGKPISVPGDMFNPDYGASLPALVDQPLTAAFVLQLQARILGALLNDPTIAPTPAPTVTVSQIDQATVGIQVKGKTVQGLPVVTPSFPIPTST